VSRRGPPVRRSGAGNPRPVAFARAERILAHRHLTGIAVAGRQTVERVPDGLPELSATAR